MPWQCIHCDLINTFSRQECQACFRNYTHNGIPYYGSFCTLTWNEWTAFITQYCIQLTGKICPTDVIVMIMQWYFRVMQATNLEEPYYFLFRSPVEFNCCCWPGSPSARTFEARLKRELLKECLKSIVYTNTFGIPQEYENMKTNLYEWVIFNLHQFISLLNCTMEEITVHNTRVNLRYCNMTIMFPVQIKYALSANKSWTLKGIIMIDFHAGVVNCDAGLYWKFASKWT